MTDDPNALKLERASDLLTDQSHEVLRVWITNEAGSTFWINARLLDDPYVFGYLMSDTVRHAAQAYATTWGKDERETLEQIVAGLSEELRRQEGDITTIQEGSFD